MADGGVRIPAPAPRGRRARLAAAVAATAALVGVVTWSVVPGATPSAAVRSTAATTPPPAGPAALLARMTEAQRVGQLFMVGAPVTGYGAATVSDVRDLGAGAVILTGRSSAGVAAVHGLTASLQSLVAPASAGGAPLVVATDQEGGYVQVLSGPGFSTIPTGLTQGGYAPAALRSLAQAWGSQLAAAGVNLDLAPIGDTVPPGTAANNPPIGVYQREFGFDPGTVSAHVTAVTQGMQLAGVATSVKHFPGLGRVTANTDTTAGVTDSITTRHDPYLAPFQAAVLAGSPFVMLSTAYYSLIDPANPAAFSPTVVTGMLRGDLGFRGVAVTDSLGTPQVAFLSPGARAVAVIAAGGDMILVTDPTLMPAMVTTVLARTAADPGFRAQVDASALRVLLAKQRLGLLGGAVGLGATPAGTVLARRADDGSVVVTENVAGAWSAPVGLGGLVSAGPAAATFPGTTTTLVAARGQDGAVWLAEEAGGRAVTGWWSIGGLTTDAPALAITPGRIDVAVRGTDGALWVRTLTAGTWGPWTRVDALLIGAPALADAASGDLVAAVTGADQQVYVARRSGAAWPPWSVAGGIAMGGPGAVTAPDGSGVDVLVRGWDGSVWMVAYGAAVGGWTALGGVVTASPVATAAGAGHAVVVAQGADAQLWQRTATGATWSPWAPLGS